jgi:hypothetical protein
MPVLCRSGREIYVQTVPEINGLIALDVSDPKKPVEASRIVFDEKFHMAHWIAADRKSDRMVVTGNDMSWALIVKIDRSHESGQSCRMAWVLSDVMAAARRLGPAEVHGALFGTRRCLAFADADGDVATGADQGGEQRSPGFLRLRRLQILVRDFLGGTS